MTTTPIHRPDGNLVGWWVQVPLLGYGRVVSHSPTDISIEFVGRHGSVHYPLASEFEVVPLLEWVRLTADGTIPTSPRHRALAGRMLKMNPESERFWNGVLCLQKLGARSGSFILSYQGSQLEKIEHARHVCALKNNITPDDIGSLDFTFEQQLLTDGLIVKKPYPRIAWIGKGKATADDVTGAQRPAKEKNTDEVDSWLRGNLTPRIGSMLGRSSAMLKKLATANGGCSEQPTD